MFSTTPDCPTPTTCTLVAPSAPAALADGVLIDFREETDSAVDYASGIAVDPSTNEVVVLGVDDAMASDPNAGAAVRLV